MLANIRVVAKARVNSHERDLAPEFSQLKPDRPLARARSPKCSYRDSLRNVLTINVDLAFHHWQRGKKA